MQSGKVLTSIANTATDLDKFFIVKVLVSYFETTISLKSINCYLTIHLGSVTIPTHLTTYSGPSVTFKTSLSSSLLTTAYCDYCC